MIIRVIFIFSAMIIFHAPTALACLTDQQLKNLNDLYNKNIGLQPPFPDQLEPDRMTSQDLTNEVELVSDDIHKLTHLPLLNVPSSPQKGV